MMRQGNRRFELLGLVAVTVASVLTNVSFGQRQYTVKRTNTPPTLDGILDAGEWDNVDGTETFQMLRQGANVTDKHGYQMKATWDDENMYLLVTSTYTDWVEGLGWQPAGEDPFPCDELRLCNGSEFGGNPDSLNFYFDPNVNDEPNQDPPDGYQIAFGLNRGHGYYVNDEVFNSWIFREGHVDTGFGNQAGWGDGVEQEFGHAKWSMVFNADENGAVVEMQLPWIMWDAGDDPEQQLLHNFAPQPDDNWYVNLGIITSDPSNFLPIWNWNSTQGFVFRPDGEFIFSSDVVGGTLKGDYNNNNQLDSPDIDELAAAVRGGTNAAKYDLDGNGTVDDNDRIYWVKDKSVANTYMGDSNLDGEFSSQDFVFVFLAGKYESGTEAGWGEGDWNGDNQFQSGDFVTAFLDGGYEAGQRPAVQSVPEPSGLLLLSFGALFALRARHRRIRS